MSFTVGEVIADVRELIQDTLEPYRYSSEFIARKTNQVVKRIATMRPDLFVVDYAHTCVAGSLQVAPTDAIRLMDVIAAEDGTAIKEVSQDVLDMMVPTWEALPAGPATNWMRYPRDPYRFYLYPAASAGSVVTITYAKCPTTLTVGSTVPLQDVYFPAVVDGTAWVMESIDAEHVESGRAKMFQDSFMGALSGGLTARRLTDTELAGLPKDEVIQ